MKKLQNLFVGYKSSRAIPVRNALTRDFLVQSTLDGGVCRIDYQPVPRTDDSIVPNGTIILERSDGRYAVDIVTEVRTTSGWGVRPEVITIVSAQYV